MGGTVSKILVTGAGGFIGHHLVKRLKAEGHFVRGIDIKYPEFEQTAADEFWIQDLRYGATGAFNGMPFCEREFDEVYSLAADMGGIGYITTFLADIARNNIRINLNMLEAAERFHAGRYLYTSSACVYNQDKQRDANVVPLKEDDAYPALPERGYGWEKLFAEQMCEYYQHDYNLDIRMVRFHNVYGPLGTYDGGKEKSPAAICRKVAKARNGGEIEVWGDGQQSRSYMHIRDCVEGLIRLMASGYQQPLNLGTDELVTVDGLVDIISGIAGKTLTKRHDLTKPQGVRGRNSDNSKLREVLGWEPKIKLEEGLVDTYRWISEQVQKA